VPEFVVVSKDLSVKKNQDKASCLTGGAHSGGNHSDMDLLLLTENYVQWQGNGYDQDNRAYLEEGKSGTVDTKSGRLKVIASMSKANCLTPDAYLAVGERKRDQFGKPVLASMCERRIRRLTPVECERLQTFPDNFTEGVSASQRYKILGNSWTVDVVVHVLGILLKGFI
jgi:site-specific DNA-cytosine methylase